MRRLPPSLLFLLACIAASTALLTALRLLFFQLFSDPADPAGPGDTLHAFYVGMKLDLRLLLCVHAPLLLLAMVPRLRVEAPRLRPLWVGYVATALTLIVFTYVVDFGHYAYLGSRIDATLLRFLYDPGASARMVWESYPVLWMLLLLVTSALALGVLFAAAARRSTSPQRHVAEGPRWRAALPYLLAVALFAGGIYGKLSSYPLRWSDAFFSPHPFTSMLALNPVLYFADTFELEDARADPITTRGHYRSIARYLGVAEQDRDADRLVFRRSTTASPRNPPPNVVIVMLESLAFFQTGFSGNPLAPTPSFDAIARDGLVFSRFYAPHDGSARGVFATLVGLPDVESTTTSSRNPTIVRQRTLVNAFEGYDKLFFVNGSASWTNMRGLLTHNIPDLELYEEGRYRSPRENVWGISDLHLFEEANRVLRERERPFFAVIQTSGNHRPYSIPDDRRGFETHDASREEVARFGFRSVRAYNALRLLDHSLGVFLEQAGRERYFDDTLFVFLGDHGDERHAEHRPKGESRLGLTEFHVPLVFYAPGIFTEPAVYETVGSQVDVLPTIAGVAGIPVVNTTLGRDLLDERFDDERYAFTIRHGVHARLGLVGRDFYLTVLPDGSERTLHEIFSETPRRNVEQRFPGVADRLERLARGLYQAARYIRENNRPKGPPQAQRGG